jgi:restriction endonuclease
MPNKIDFKINNWQYGIHTNDEAFAEYLQKEISKDFHQKPAINSKKALLEAYIKAKYELWSLDQEIEKISNLCSLT